MVPCSFFYEKQHPATRTFPPVLRNVVGKPLKQMFAEFKARPALSPTQTCQNIVIIIPSFFGYRWKAFAMVMWDFYSCIVFRDLLDSVVLLCSRSFCSFVSLPPPIPPNFLPTLFSGSWSRIWSGWGGVSGFSQVAFGPAERWKLPLSISLLNLL